MPKAKLNTDSAAKGSGFATKAPPLPDSIKEHLRTAKDQAARRSMMKTLLGQQEGKAYQMPAVSTIPDTETMQRAVEMLQRAVELKREIEQREKEYKRLKDEIVAIAVTNEIPGYRYGKDAVMIGMQSRSSLSKEKLLENGVDPLAIAESMVEGEEYYTVRFGEING